MAAIFAAALVWIHSAAALEAGPEGKAAGEQKAVVTGADLRPPKAGEAGEADKKRVTIILGETAEGRRELVVALSVAAGAREAGRLAARGLREIRSSITGREERYEAWVRGELVSGESRAPTGIVELSEVRTTCEVSCAGSVKAGEQLVLQVKSLGDVDEAWDVLLVYPEGGSYERQRLTVGGKVGGGERIAEVKFATYKADRGKLLGMRIERVKDGEGHTLWVQVQP